MWILWFLVDGLALGNLVGDGNPLASRILQRRASCCVCIVVVVGEELIWGRAIKGINHLFFGVAVKKMDETTAFNLSPHLSGILMRW